MSGPFKYFMVLIDVFTQWTHTYTYLLSIRNHVFAKPISQIIALRAMLSDPYEWIMLVSLSPKHLMTIVWS